jgi:hypothetical protein
MTPIKPRREYQFKLKRTDRLLATDERFTDRFLAAACLTLPEVYLHSFEAVSSPTSGKKVVSFRLTSNELTIEVSGEPQPYFRGRMEQFFARDPGFPIVPGDNRDVLDQLMDIITETIRLTQNPVVVAEAELAEGESNG